MPPQINDVNLPLQSKHPSCILVLALDSFTSSHKALHALEQALDSPQCFPYPEGARQQQQQQDISDSPAASSYILVEAKIPDSTANIFRISVHAYQFGWSRIILADSLSSKQALGATREGQEEQLSVVVVEITPATSPVEKDIAPATSSVYRENKTKHGSMLAKRFSFEEVKDLTRASKSGTRGKWIIDLPEKVEDYPHQGAINPNTFYYAGIPLYDPKLPVFDHTINLPDPSWEHTTAETNTDDTEDQKASKALKAMQGLPTELVYSILDAYSVETNLDEMTSAPSKFENLLPEQMEVHVLYPIPKRELVKLEERINEILLQEYQEKQTKRIEGCEVDQSKVDNHLDLSQPRCRLHPWRALHPASRLDAWCLFQRYVSQRLHEEHPVFAFLLPQIAPESESSLQIGLIQRVYSLCACWNLLPVAKAFDFWYGKTIEHRRDEGSLYSNPPNLEFGLDYSSPFYWEPPCFVSMLDGVAPPVFLLTRHLSEDELGQILEEIEIMTEFDDSHSPEGGKIYALVPWQHDVDGDLDDAWRLAWDVLKYPGVGSTDTCIFIDKQSAEDKTVMISHLMYTWDPQPDGSKPPLADPDYGPWTGIMHGRKPGREAHIIWCNLDVANMGMTDYWDESEIGKHWRPGLVPKDSWDTLTY